MLNVSVMLPTYGEYMVENKGAVSKDAHGVRAKIDKCRTYAKQRMNRKQIAKAVFTLIKPQIDESAKAIKGK